MPAILSAQSLNLWYGAHQALHDISIDIPEKSITALIGPSGCGKSTFLKTLNRMNDLIDGVKITGSVTYEGANIYDVTFENVQAGLRTDYLFRIANHRGGIVLGTGDLSELALGWCTYGVGDQMSHYAVNTGVPKTMIQHLIRWVAASGQFSDATGEVLLSILATEISPELIPTKPGEKIQSTQDTIGPYNLQDFTLFHLLRRGARPSKIAFLAEKAKDEKDLENLAETSKCYGEIAEEKFDDWLIPGRYLVFGDHFDLADLKAAELTPLTVTFRTLLVTVQPL